MNKYIKLFIFSFIILFIIMFQTSINNIEINTYEDNYRIYFDEVFYWEYIEDNISNQSICSKSIILSNDSILNCSELIS